jgi:hypothetical protein
MAMKRGYPDRRGMGAQSDFVSSTFDPGQQYKTEQMNRARVLVELGIAPEKIAEMLSMPVEIVLSVQADRGISSP